MILTESSGIILQMPKTRRLKFYRLRIHLYLLGLQIVYVAYSDSFIFNIHV